MVFRRVSWVIGVLLGGAGCLAGRGADLPYQDTTLTFEARAADLVARMTPEERCAQLHVHVNANGRLGIPAIDWWTEANHGLSNRGPGGNVTVFPQAIGMAATFDPGIIKKIGDATSTEARARFQSGGIRYRGLALWAPTINLVRDPRWGRAEETYGEDPYLTGQMAIAMCQGMQGDDPKYLKTVAVPKHFAVHSGDATRFSRSNDCPEPLIRDYYFPAFHDAFGAGKALGTMVAFSGINGTPDTANHWLMTDVLRKQWGFQGIIVSDNGGVSQLITGQRFAKSDEEAVAAALNAGLTIITDAKDFTPAIMHAISQGTLQQETVDKACLCNLLVRFRLGEFDPPAMVPYTKIPASAVGTKESSALALQTAEEAFVLLQNNPAPKGSGFEKILPLDLRRINSVALIGPGVTGRPQFGAYSGNPANPSPSFLDALHMQFGERVRIRTAYASDGDNAVAVAKSSDVVIFIGGLTMAMEHEGIDRTNLNLPPDQVAILPKLSAANPAMVVALEGGSAMDLRWVKAHVPAVVMMWYGGEQGATALARILTGQANPSGRLPLTFYRALDDLPAFEDYDITHGKTYWYLPKEKPAAFCFGHGLSYTTFEYENLQAPAIAGKGDKIMIQFDLKNTGKVDGAEVAQLYVREVQPLAGMKRPIKQLKGFSRVMLAAGNRQTISLTLPVASLAFWSVAEGNYAVDSGEYELEIGASSEDIRLRGKLTVN